MKQERLVYNVHALLGDLKSCSVTKDLQRGRRIHAKAVETGSDSDLFVVTALIKMYAKCRAMVEAHRVFDRVQHHNVKTWTALLLGYAENGEGSVALDLFTRMKSGGFVPDSVTYVAALKACTHLAGIGDGLERGRQIHSQIGCHMNRYVQNMLINMYAKCGSTVDACCVFENIPDPDVVSWNALLLGYAASGKGYEALDCFSRMAASGCTPSSVTYIAVLKACTSLALTGDVSGCLQWGRKLQAEIGCHSDRFVQNTLIGMYGKCGSMLEARSVFDSIQKPDIVSWNTLLLGYAENGEEHVALDLFSRVKTGRGLVPDSFTYIAVLKCCSSMPDNSGKNGCLDRGRQIHAEISCNLDDYVRNALIDMYAKCGSMVEAQRVFDSIQKPSVVSWTALVLGYAENGEGLVALDRFTKIKAHGCVPNSVTYVAALKACTSLAVKDAFSGKEAPLRWGKEIHSEIGSRMNRYVQSTLVDMYAKCGSMSDARRVFDSLQQPDVVSWNALLLGYAENGEPQVSIDLFFRMKSAGICVPTSVTYVSVLKACTAMAVSGGCRKEECLQLGSEVHSEIGCHQNHYVESALIDMYAKCGSMANARRVFNGVSKPDVVSWNALLLGYAENGDGVAALELFWSMTASGCSPDSVTYIAALKSCSLIGDLDHGRKVHSAITEFTPNVVTILVGFYAKCGSMVDASAVFDLHSRGRNVSTWTALLAGYAAFGDTGSVFKLFEAMRAEGVRPDAVTFVCVLLCCSHAGLVEKAREYFETLSGQYKLTPTVMHYTCMVDVLGRANRVSEAMAMLRTMHCTPDAVTWMALLGACHKWRNPEVGRMAFQSFVWMDRENAASAHILMAHIHDRYTEAWKLLGGAYVSALQCQSKAGTVHSSAGT